MNNEVAKEIVVKIRNDNEKVFLDFHFDEILFIELTSDNQQQLKTLFENILKKIVLEKIVLKFDDQGKEDLFTEVSKKYIAHLDAEISSLYETRVIDLENE